MRRSTLIARMLVLAVLSIGVATCATPPPPEPPPPASVPVVTAPPPAPPAQAAHSPDEDWNIFPDPTTGTIDVYHKGEYLGQIDGTEPAEQDPPLPHKSGAPRQDQ